MCGIAGILDLEGHVVTRDEVSSMIRSIQHRGPDDSGVHVGHAIGLANARLAISDLSDAGHQPMQSDDESLVPNAVEEILRYLAAVEVFRAEACEPHWRS